MLMNILSGLLISGGIILGGYGSYKLGMWSVRKRLVDTKKDLINRREELEGLLGNDAQLYNIINEIDNHIKEIDEFRNNPKIKKSK